MDVIKHLPWHTMTLLMEEILHPLHFAIMVITLPLGFMHLSWCKHFFISRLSTQHINIPSREHLPLGWDYVSSPAGYFTMSLLWKNISSSGSREPNVHHLNQHTTLLQPKSHLQCFYTAFLRKKLRESPSGGEPKCQDSFSEVVPCSHKH